MSVLIDTSCWIEGLRRDGDPGIRQQIRHLLLSGEAATCSMVLLELWNGARGDYEKSQLWMLEDTLINLTIDDTVWKRSKELASLCHGKGLTIPSTDLLIIAVSLRYDVSLIHSDKHFDLCLGSMD